MRQNREQGRASATKAEAIHSVKRNLYQNPREVYLQEEFALLAAIRKGDKERARSIINRILIRIYALGGEDLDVLKTLVLEMVVLMYRTAVDKGANPRELLGVNSSYLKEFNDIKDYIELSHWLTGWLEDFISSSLIQVTPAPPDSIALALEFMKNNLAEPLTRDEVARACNMSYGYFSKIFHQKTGLHLHRLVEQVPHREGLHPVRRDQPEHQPGGPGVRLHGPELLQQGVPPLPRHQPHGLPPPQGRARPVAIFS